MTGPAVHLHTVFTHAPRPALAGQVAIVIDQLRASTTIATALAHGASSIFPTLTPAAAITAKRRSDRATPASSPCILGGERGGILIDGFDLGNSPREYTAAAVGGRTLAFTTTNGTAALQHAAGAQFVLVGCLANAAAIVKAAYRAAAFNTNTHQKRRAPLAIHLLCAGTRRTVTLEDCLVAGLMASRLAKLGCDLDGGVKLPDGDDTARLCALLAERVHAEHGWLAALKTSRGGRNCARVGLGSDVADCAKVDSLSVVPRYRSKTAKSPARITLMP